MDSSIRSAIMTTAQSLGYQPRLAADGSDRLKKLIALDAGANLPPIYIDKTTGQSADPGKRYFKVTVHPQHFHEPSSIGGQGIAALLNRSGETLHSHSGYIGLQPNSEPNGEPQGRSYRVETIEALRILLAAYRSVRPNQAAERVKVAPAWQSKQHAPTCSPPSFGEQSRITQGLVVDSPWVDLLLNGVKTWEMRSSKTSKRGRFGLIAKGTGMVVGEIDLIDCVGPLSSSALKANEHRHAITPSRKAPEEWIDRWNVAWVMANACRYKTPRPYHHPSGAVIWVNL